jgi:hypothetical protein
MNRKFVLTCVALAAAGWSALPAGYAQDTDPKRDSRPQAQVASTKVKFAILSPKAREYKEAKAVTDVEGAKKLVGKLVTFKGTVIQVFAPEDNSRVILTFAKDSKSALTVVVRNENFSRFPELEDLKGKFVVFTGRVLENEERFEVVLIRPGQLKIVE